MSTGKPTILIVDDESINISILMSFLKSDYRIIAAKSGEQAFDRLTDEILPDIILLDAVMPDMEGYQVCKKIKSNPVTQHIPVIFISSMNNHLDETNGFKMGAADYITKPISPPIVLARVKTHLNLARVRQLLVTQNQQLEKTIQERTDELIQTQDITILALATLAETRDNETGNHIRRTQNYVKALAIELSKEPQYSHFLTKENIDLLFKSAPLHDIGKVGIPDNILLKPAKLSENEFQVMKNHASLGDEALSKAEELLGNGNISFLRFAREIASGHHEKWDGSGYPNGLAGEDIPFSARLMAVADVYDALISKRVYKPAFTHDKAISIIEEGSGKHFDPEIVKVFLRIQNEFDQIANRFSDSD